MSGGMLDLPRSRARRGALFMLASFFVFAGVNHFVNPEFYVAIMPPWLPAHAELVALSGVCEILGGLGVLHPATRSAAGWALMALLVAIFPANLHMALHPEIFVPRGIPRWALYGRLPFQIVFLAWTWWATRPEESPR